MLFPSMAQLIMIIIMTQNKRETFEQFIFRAKEKFSEITSRTKLSFTACALLSHTEPAASLLNLLAFV